MDMEEIVVKKKSKSKQKLKAPNKYQVIFHKSGFLRNTRFFLFLIKGLPYFDRALRERILDGGWGGEVPL